MNQKVNCYINKKLLVLSDVFVFDSNEPSNCECWKRLPSFFQDYITTKHNVLRSYVSQLLEKIKLKPVFVSGFRSVAVNKACGGVSDSMHLYGLAVDFIPVDNFNNICLDESQNNLLELNQQNKFQDFTLIYENTHYHLQFNRKN